MSQIGEQPNPFSAKKLEGGGRINVGVTPVAVSFASEIRSVLITADDDNTVRLYIGLASVASDGSNAITYLNGGDDISIDYNDCDGEIYVVAAADGQYFWKGGTL